LNTYLALVLVVLCFVALFTVPYYVPLALAGLIWHGDIMYWFEDAQQLEVSVTKN